VKNVTLIFVLAGIEHLLDFISLL